MQITAYYGIVLDACIALSCQKLVNKNQTIGGARMAYILFIAFTSFCFM